MNSLQNFVESNAFIEVHTAVMEMEPSLFVTSQYAPHLMALRVGLERLGAIDFTPAEPELSEYEDNPPADEVVPEE